MKYWTQLLVETLIVALVNAVVGSLISLALMFMDRNFRLEDYHFWPQVALSFALAGALIHLGFEFSGLNRFYMRFGAADK